MRRRWLRTLGFAVVVVALSCGGRVESVTTSRASPTPCDVSLDRFKELIVVDEAVLSDGRSLNATGGPWSFRHLMESMAPAGEDPGDFVRSWLEEWGRLATFNGYPLDTDGSRAAKMNSLVLCPWMQSNAANQCDATCSHCAQQVLDLRAAPFRLIAIANRMDLRTSLLASGPAGEGELVFALTTGPADVQGSAPGSMTLSFSYTLPDSAPGGGHGVKGWAAAWHALGTPASGGDAYLSALQGVTDGFTARGLAPSKPNGSSLAQLRTNDSALAFTRQLRDFRLGASDGELHVSSTDNTPAAALNGTSQLGDLLSANREKVLQHTWVVPAELLGGSSEAFVFHWAAPNVETATLSAFAQGTCNGCHSQNQPVDQIFHVSPFRSGDDKLSPFVNNPDATGNGDDLTVREASLKQALCAP